MTRPESSTPRAGGADRSVPDRVALVDVEVDGVPGCTVRVTDGTVVAVGPRVRPEPRDEVVSGEGGALLPGLHDHHLHLRALAAASVSVACGPPAVSDRDALAAAVRVATPHRGWIRGTGYHASVAGDLDRHALDALRVDVPVRIQDRSGVRWYLNSAAVETLSLDRSTHPGIERDDAGAPTGVLTRADDLVAGAGGPASDVAEVGGALARRGVTGVTDATVGNDADAFAAFQHAVEVGELPQRLLVLGRPELAEVADHPRVRVGGVKIVLDEVRLPALDDLVEGVNEAHRQGRGVAVHAVTRATLALTVAALRAAGASSRDRVEHASVCPPDLATALAELDVTVVTQPNFVAERGERYRVEVDPDDVPWLYPVALLDRGGVAVAGGTDAPFGRPDPWAAIAAAVERRAADGAVLGADHRIDAARALALFLGPLEAPGAAPRRVEVAGPAELCLLDAPLAVALRAPSAAHVRATLTPAGWFDGPAA